MQWHFQIFWVLCGGILGRKEETLGGRVVNGFVPVRIHGGSGTGTIKEKVEPDPNLKPFRNQFLGSGTGTRTIYGTTLDPSPGLSRE